nr:sialate O-acetylesterase [Parvularcula maris]
MAALVSSCTQGEEPEPKGEEESYRLYLLAGQSNMEGYGDVAELPEGLRGPVEGAVIYHLASTPDDEPSEAGAEWRELRLGFGSVYPPEGVTEQFGPELSFGRAVVSGGPVALIKYARGGTAIMPGVSGYGSWDPAYGEGEGVNQFDHALAVLEAARAADDVDGDGRAERLVPSGIVWMQGEADAFGSAEAAAAYQANLDRLIEGLREAMGRANLPVVIGRIVDSRPPGGEPVMAYAAEVQAAQARWAEADPCASLVTALPQKTELGDGWHYGAEGQLNLGRAFAEALAALEERCPPAE